MNTDRACGAGILAIWNDCAPHLETVYERWYQTEHLQERLSIPGFRRGRRYQAVAADRQYFIYYETATADVLQSAAYAERVENPTALTRRIMTTAVIGMNRTACRRVAARGAMRGTFAVTARFSGAVQPPSPGVLAGASIDDAELARAELWTAVATAATAPSKEETLRGGDDRVGACVMFELLREASGLSVAEHLRAAFPDAQIGVYRLLCELQAADARTADGP